MRRGARGQRAAAVKYRRKAIQQRQAELIKAVAKAGKDDRASSATVTAASLGLDRARYVQTRKDKLEFAERGAARARPLFV